MAETKEVKKRAPRKPKTEAEVPLKVNEIKEITETPAIKEEIAENQSGPSADEVAALAKEAENTLEIAEPKVVEIKDEIAEKENEIVEEGDEVAEKKEEVIPEEEIAEKEEESPEISDEGTQLPEDITPFEEFEAPKEGELEKEIAPEKEEAVAPSSKVAAKIKKLNPYLEDFQSKWIAIVECNGLTHKLFKGSYAKAINAAENYNISHGIGKGQVIKIRK